jgi:hypothetical protein
VRPIEICEHLGPERVDAYYAELSGTEVRQVLRAAGTSAAVPKTAYTKAGRLKAWRARFDAEFARGNEQLALALLLEWLMRHHRTLLVAYLDDLGIKHNQGETDEDFCETRTPEQLREAARKLLAAHPPHQVATYLLLVGHLQETHVFDQTPELLQALGLDAAAAAAYVEAHIAAHGVATSKSSEGAAQGAA